LFDQQVLQPCQAVAVLDTEEVLVRLLKVYLGSLDMEQVDRFPEEMDTCCDQYELCQ